MRKLPAVFALALKYLQPAVGKMTFIRQVTPEGDIDNLDQTSSRQTVKVLVCQLDLSVLIARSYLKPWEACNLVFRRK